MLGVGHPFVLRLTEPLPEPGLWLGVQNETVTAFIAAKKVLRPRLPDE